MFFKRGFLKNHCVRMLRPSLFNQSHLFKTKIEDNGVLNFCFFVISLCTHVWRGREIEGGYVPKCKAAYSHGGKSKNWSFCIRS